MIKGQNRKGITRSNLVKGTSTFAIAALLAMPAGGVYAAQDNTTTNNLVKNTLAYKAEKYTKDGMVKVKVAKKLFDTKEFKVERVGDMYTSSGEKFESNIMFETKISADKISKKLLSAKALQSAINNTEHTELPYLGIDFTIRDDKSERPTYLYCRFVNLKNIDKDTLTTEEQKLINKLSSKKVVGIYEIGEDYYQVFKKRNKISAKKISMKNCANVDEYSMILDLVDTYDVNINNKSNDYVIKLNMTNSDSTKKKYYSYSDIDMVNILSDLDRNLNKEQETKFNKFLLSLEKFYEANDEKSIQNSIKNAAKVNAKLNDIKKK